MLHLSRRSNNCSKALNSYTAMGTGMEVSGPQFHSHIVPRVILGVIDPRKNNIGIAAPLFREGEIDERLLRFFFLSVELPTLADFVHIHGDFPSRENFCVKISGLGEGKLAILASQSHSCCYLTPVPRPH